MKMEIPEIFRVNCDLIGFLLYIIREPKNNEYYALLSPLLLTQTEVLYFRLHNPLIVLIFCSSNLERNANVFSCYIELYFY